MTVKSNHVHKVLSSVETPVLVGYTGDKGFPEKTIISSHVCPSCDTKIITNKLKLGSCPSCASVLKLDPANKDAVVFSKKDFENLKAACSCDCCGVAFVSTSETITSLADEKVYCVVCSEEMKINSDDAAPAADATPAPTADNSDETVADSDYNSDSDNSDSGSDDSSGDDDVSDADKELQDMIAKHVSKTDDSDTSTDDSAAPSSDDSAPAPDTTSTDDSSSKDDDSSATTASIYNAQLKLIKKPNIVASQNYEHWYLFDGTSPIAVASMDKANNNIRPIFRTLNYGEAFATAIASEGINQTIMADFGFQPVEIGLTLDDVTAQIVEDKIKEKTDELNDRIKNTSELFEQSLSIAALGNIKGIFTEANNLRKGLVDKLKAVHVRNAESLVDSVMMAEMKPYIKAIVVKANELVNKSPESLQEIAAMISTAEYRTPIMSSEVEGNVSTLPISVTPDIDFEKDNNLKTNQGKGKVQASDLMSVINKRRG